MRRVLLIAFSYPPVEIVGSVKVQGAYRQSKLVVETEYRDVVEGWKARVGFDRKLGVYEQFGLPFAKKRGSALPHTWLLNFAKYLLTYPDPRKGWIPSALEALHEIRRQNLDIAAIVTTSP